MKSGNPDRLKKEKKRESERESGIKKYSSITAPLNAAA
jgi:hypothetical protein